MDSGITVTEHTRQTVFLGNLTQAARQPGTLYIYVESLPMYLSTSIAFSIFNFKLKNYPRRIIWRTKNEEIYEVLADAGMETDYGFLVSKELREEKIPQIEPTTVNKPVQDSTPVYAAPADPAPAQPPEVDEFDFNAMFAGTATIDQQDSFFQTAQEEVAQEKTSESSNFDSLMNKIEATKDALDKMKDNPNERTRVPSSPHEKPAAVKEKPKVFMYISSIFTAAVGLMVALILFPTTVYTLSISTPTLEDEISITIPTDAFSVQSVTLSESSSTTTSGILGEDSTVRPSGLVTMINVSDEDITLSKGEFYFDADGLRYDPILNETQPDLFVLPANRGDQIELTVQAQEIDNVYELREKQTLNIFNLLGQKVCEKCFAEVLEEINSDAVLGSRTVTEGDRQVLRSTLDSLIAQKRVETYFDLSSSTTISDPTWFNNVESTFEFSNEEGEVAEELSLEVSVDTELYYLPRSEIEMILMEENSDAQKILDLDLVETSGDFSDSDEIDITFNYSYEGELSIDRNDIETTLKENEISDAQAAIQDQYPAVKKISKQDTGIAIPGLPKRVNVNIVTN